MLRPSFRVELSRTVEATNPPDSNQLYSFRASLGRVRYTDMPEIA
jgi:hypothetical protein